MQATETGSTMAGVDDRYRAPGESRRKFHLIDLVSRDCCDTEVIDLETRLARLEESLNNWLREKIIALECERSTPSLSHTGANAPHGLTNDKVATRGGPGIEEKEVIVMSTDDRDILEVLQAELKFIEQGGYGRSPRTPWKPKSAFQDSLTCINYQYPNKVHPCTACHLIEFVPPEARSEEIPCHFIPLNESGDTLDQLEAEDNQQKLEEALKAWLRARIKEISAAAAHHTG
jgi:hypothetical protein